MQLTLISYPLIFKNEIEVLNGLFERHSFVFHLRKPGATKNEIRTYLERIPPVYHQRIVLHSNFELHESFNVKGAHFSTNDRVYNKHEAFNGFKTTSCHSLTEIEEIKNSFNYCFLSPVFPSISKPGYIGHLDLDAVSEYMHMERKCKVIALGGINKSNIEHAMEYGFDGIALLGSVWTNNPELYCNHIHNNLKEITECLPKGHIA